MDESKNGVKREAVEETPSSIVLSASLADDDVLEEAPTVPSSVSSAGSSLVELANSVNGNKTEVAIKDSSSCRLSVESKNSIKTEDGTPKSNSSSDPKKRPNQAPPSSGSSKKAKASFHQDDDSDSDDSSMEVWTSPNRISLMLAANKTKQNEDLDDDSSSSSSSDDEDDNPKHRRRARQRPPPHVESDQQPLPFPTVPEQDTCLSNLFNDHDRRLQRLLWDCGCRYCLLPYQVRGVREIAGVDQQYPPENNSEESSDEEDDGMILMTRTNASKSQAYWNKILQATPLRTDTRGLLMADDMGLGVSRVVVVLFC